MGESQTTGHRPLAGRFELRQQLGEGGMGVVYRAWDTSLGKDVALKRMRELGSRDGQKLKSEFRARCALQHKNLVQLFELMTEGEECFFTMELVEGTDLATWVRRGAEAIPPSGPRATGPNSSNGSNGSSGDAAHSSRDSKTATTIDGRGRKPKEPSDAKVTMKSPSSPAPAEAPRLDAAGIARLRAALTELCQGLSVLHEAGIVHRDVKPANVRVTSAGRVVLLDFGLAASPTVPLGMMVAGTPRYMAPEQVRAEPTTPATDLYAVGVILYELLAGHSPFGGSVLSLQLHKASDERAPPILRGSPDDDLADLAMALLEPDPAARPDARTVLQRLAGDGDVPSVGPTFGLPVSGGFFGRQREIDALGAAIRRVTSEPGRGPAAVLVEGPSGIGKTTLVRWFLADLKKREPKTLVLASRCHPQESVPFKALDAAMDSLADHAANMEDLGDFEPAQAQAAIRLFPVLKSIVGLSRHPAPAERPDDSELRARGVEALRDLLGRFAARGPLVLWVDDVQWDDADSVALVEALLRPRGAPPLLLLLGMRSENRTSAIVERLSEARSPVALERIPLGPLGEGDVARLAATFLDPSDARIPGVVTQSEGNAFLACELARYLAAAPAESASSFPREGFDVKALVAARLRDLLPAERALLDVAALAVRPLPVACALEAARLGSESRTAVLALRDAFLIRQGAGGADEIAPYHDKIAEATQQLLSEADRTSIHRSLAETLERHEPDDADALCVHWERAGDLGRAGKFAFRAAESAAATLAFGRAAELYEKAIAFDWSGVERAVLLERAARACANHGQAHDAARRYLDASGLLGDDVGDARVRTLKRLAAEQYVKSGYVREGWNVMRSVLDAAHVPLPSSPKSAMVAALGRRMKFLARRLDIDAIGDRVIPEAERARLEILWTASTSMSMVNVTLSDAFRTLHLERILDVGDRSSIARALAYEVALEAHVGGPLFDWHAARLLDHARRLVERTGDPYDDAWLKLGVANEAFCAGRFRDAVVACEASEKILRTRCHGVAWEITTVSAFLLMSLAMLGDLKKLRDAADRIRVESEANGDLFGIADAYSGDCILAWWASGQGDDALARTNAVVARQGGNASEWPEKNYRRGQLTELVATVHLGLLKGDPWPAWSMMVEQWDALKAAMIPSLQFYRSWLRSARARVALACAKDAERSGGKDGWTRAKLLADVKKTHAEMAKDKRPFGPPLAALIEGALASAKDDAKAARAALERAVVGFDRAEMALYREAARHRLAEISGSSARRDEAEAWLRAQGVSDVRALVDALVPGY